jgi:hypothetical protein
MNFLNRKMHGLRWPKLVELGASKMEGQFLALGQCQISIIFLDKIEFFQRTKSVGLCGNLNGSMLDYARFVELCQICWIMLGFFNRPGFFALRPSHMKKLAPVIILS